MTSDNTCGQAEPLISVITITYNAAGCIAPTLASVRSQTFDDFEHIVVDGASTDDTVALVRRDGLPGTRLLSEPDRGLYFAMNKGLGMARGRYVLFLNAGDAFHTPSTLADYAVAASRGADIIYGDTVIVDAGRNVVAPRHLSAPASLTADSFSHGMLICHQAFMVRRALAPAYDTSYRFSADYDWCIRCIDASAPELRINLGEVTIDYLSDGLTDRHHGESLRERYRIMAARYGTATAVWRHLSFIPRAVARRFRRGSD